MVKTTDGPVSVDASAPSVSVTNTPNVSVTNTPSVSVSGTPNVAVTNTPSVSVSNTPAVTVSGTPSVTVSNTPSVTVSGTPTVAVTTMPDVTVSGSVAVSNTPSVTVSNTPSVTVSGTPTVAVTTMPAVTVSGTVAVSNTPSVTVSGTPSVTVSGTPTVSVSNTPSVTVSGTPTVSVVGKSNVRNAINISDLSNTLSTWTTVSSASGDIIAVDGNSIGSNYIVISTDPFAKGTETVLRYANMTFNSPIRIQFGISRSLPVAGTEFSAELVANDFTSAESSIPISTINQTTTTLTVVTTGPHNLTNGKCIAIGDCIDTRLNYAALVVASVPNSTTFTATAGPNGTIPSLTLSGSSGNVYIRSRMGWSRSGTSMIFENATATNATIFTKSNAGDVYPTGTIIGNQSITVGTTQSVVPVSANTTYCFQASTVYGVVVDHESVTWVDKSPIDSATTIPTVRLKRDQIIPGQNENFVFQYRVNKSQGAPVLLCEITTATKSGSTTATITTSTPHGLVTGNYVTIYGIIDQTNFPNVTTAVTVTVTSTTTFTAIIGATTTGSSIGGFVALAQGSQILPGVAAGATQAIVNLNRTNNIVGVTGSATWVASFVVGDYVHIYGTNNSSFNGPYECTGISTTYASFTPLLPANTGVDIAPLGNTTGGSIIRRSDLRIHFTRIIQYDRAVVEVNSINRSNDVSLSTGVSVNNTPAVTVSGTAAVNIAQIAAGVAGTVTPATNRALIVALAGSASNADVTSAARTATGNSGTIADDCGGSCSALVNVTLVSGTTPTLDLVLQESYDNGTNWQDIYHCERITAVTTAFIPVIPIGGRVRWVWNIGGTTPSFTFTVTRMRNPISTPMFRQFFDRTANLLNGTASATSSTYLIAGCKVVHVRLNMGTITTAATYMPQFSDDGINWSNGAGAATAAVASTVTTISLSNVASRFLRIIVVGAGTSQVGNYVSISAVN